MGFLNREKVPDELPDLALDNSDSVSPVSVPVNIKNQFSTEELSNPVSQAESLQGKNNGVNVEPIRGEDYLEFSQKSHGSNHEEIKQQISSHLSDSESVTQEGFFDKILEDINGEIEDLGKLGDWYEKKFLPQDVISDMKGYWEGNKADIIIKSFGAEYKKKINEQIGSLQTLEEDWREIYFKLIKKEEEMKKEEKELKNTLSEFVNLCKRKKTGDEEN